MDYFKHNELATQYHVSLKTVHNWIDAAKKSKLDLHLTTTTSGTYISKSPENNRVLHTLSDNGKKYRNSMHQKTIKPTAEFYEIFGQRQILDIINNIEVHREIPSQYSYVDKGAAVWDSWVQEQIAKQTDSMVNASILLIKSNLDTLDSLLKEASKVNVIDLGAGNGYPAKELLTHLHDNNKLNRYIGIDISESMLSILEANIHDWFNGSVRYEGYQRDITFERFDDLVMNDVMHNDVGKTVNLVLLMGGTITNFRSYDEAFRTIYNSMHKNDLILYTDKPDSPVSRSYFKYSSVFSHMLGFLNIESSLYEREAGFDSEQLMRYDRITFKTAVSIEFTFGQKPYRVNIDKGESLTLQHIWHLNVLEIIAEFDRTGFEMLHSSVTKDRQYLLSISGVNTKIRRR